MDKLTTPQLLALVDLSERKQAAPYQIGTLAAVLRRLGYRGLAECIGGSGNNAIWRITEAGRAALTAGQEARAVR